MKHLLRREGPGPRRPAFTLLELLVVIFLIAIVTAILLPTITRQREHSGCRVQCGSNLRQIGQAMLMYSNENNGNYPRGVWVPGLPPAFSEDTTNGGAPRNPFAPGATPANDVAVALWLLVRTQDITTEVFVCPSSNAEKDDFGGGATPALGATAANKTSFSSLRKNLSYGLANPYPTADLANAVPGYKWNNTLGAEFPLAADIGPGVAADGYDVTLPTPTSTAKEMSRANSRNHQGAGINVLYGDGHVEFVQNPFCGTQRDHIYTNSPNPDTYTSRKPPVGLDAIPGWHADSVILPQW